MPKQKITNYYCVVKRDKFGPYELVFKRNTTRVKVREELVAEGYRVLKCMSPKDVRKVKSYKNYGDYILDGRRSMNLPNNAFKFMRSIELLPEDLRNTIVKQYNRSIRKWEAFLQDDNKNKLSEIEQRQTKEEINALTESDFTLLMEVSNVYKN
jgi:hypothetical protein